MNKKVTSTVFAIALLAGTTPAWAEETPNQTSATTGTQTQLNVTTTTTDGNADSANQSAGSSTAVSVTSDNATSIKAVNPESFLYKLKDLLNQLQVLFTFDDK